MVGDVEDKDVVITDDILAGGNTLVDAATKAKENGARRIIATLTHGLFLDDVEGINARTKIEQSPIDKVFITDTICQREDILSNPKIEVVSVDELLADAIFHIHTGEHLIEEFK